ARGVPGEVGDVGSQVLEAVVAVDGPARSTPATVPGGLGRHAAGELDVEVSASGRLVAGAPVGLRARVAADGADVRLRPWLGMEGHLMLRHRDSGVFAHVHAVGPMAPVPVLAGLPAGPEDPIAAQLGKLRGGSEDGSPPASSEPAADSTVDFSYSFPAAGGYDAWLQFRHGDRVVTVPLRLEVGS
ncbi:MAG: hypothetical protein ACRCYR_09705, partial [Phycicoccus sp.]